MPTRLPLPHTPSGTPHPPNGGLYVYRLLRSKDLEGQLKGRTVSWRKGGRTASQQTHAPPSNTHTHNHQVYVKWPDDGIWYEAVVTSHDARRGKARLDYEATSETETVTLTDLVTAKQIAFRETRPDGHKRAKGELAVARGNSIAAARASDASESGGSSDDDSDDDDGAADSGGSDRVEPASPRAASRKRLLGGGGGSAPKRAAPPPPPRRAPPPTLDTEAATARIVVALQTGLEMAAAEGGGGGGADAGAVATAVEAAAATTYGRSSKDYKTRVRSLVFNLKDPANKELRGRVLGGGIEPHDLVRLPPEALASKELAAWRAKAESDALRAAVLDEEAAAKISTAAAVDAARHAKGGGGLAETDWRDGSAVAAAPADARAPTLPQPEGGGSAIDAGDAPAVPVSPRVASVSAAGEDNGDAAPRAAVDWTALRSRVGAGGDKSGATTKPSTSAPAVDFAEFDEFVAAQVAAADGGGGGGGGGGGDTPPRPAALPPPPTDPPLKPTLFMTFPASGPDAGWAGDVLPGGGGTAARGARAVIIAGRAPLSTLLPPTLDARSRLALPKLDTYCRELASSKTRCLTLAGVEAGSGEYGAALAAAAADLSSRGRAGFAPLGQGGPEPYLVPSGTPLADRLLAAAAAAGGGLPPWGGEAGHLLLLVVHRRDAVPPPAAVAPPPMPALDFAKIGAFLRSLGK